MPRKPIVRTPKSKPAVVDDTLDPLLSQDGRAALQALRDAATELNNATDAGHHARQRIDVGLTRAARSVVQACSSLSAADVETLRSHARTAGLTKKSSTGRAYAMMRIACGTSLSVSMVARAAKLCDYILDQGLTLDSILPERSPFWRVFELHCGKQRSAATGDRVAVLMTPDLSTRLRGGEVLTVTMTWNKAAKYATANVYASVSAGEALPLAAAAVPSLMIAYEVAVADAPQIPDPALVSTETFPATETAPVQAELGRELDAHQPVDDEVPCFVFFAQNLKTENPGALAKLNNAGAWCKIALNGKQRTVWRGRVNATIRLIIDACRGQQVVPDRLLT